MQRNVCKICRRTGQKLFLKGERCFSPKCALVKKPTPPGQKAKNRRSRISEYGKELKEKQKLRSWYGLSESQFKKYVKSILLKGGKVDDASLELIKLLEKRLDNVIFRLGFASSRRQARQLLSHGFFLVNNKPVNIPSFKVKKNNVISVKEQKKKAPFLKNRVEVMAHIETPSWLKLDKKKLEGKVVDEPTFVEGEVTAEISSVFEFYSR